MCIAGIDHICPFTIERKKEGRGESQSGACIGQGQDTKICCEVGIENRK